MVDRADVNICRAAPNSFAGFYNQKEELVIGDPKQTSINFTANTGKYL
jgi:hypothetical protein